MRVQAAENKGRLDCRHCCSLAGLQHMHAHGTYIIVQQKATDLDGSKK